jgi:hypothetical protein
LLLWLKEELLKKIDIPSFNKIWAFNFFCDIRSL